MLSVIGFLAILGPLVMFHELGHFFFARLFNVKAEIFSIGFGPRLWNRQIGETEWRLSAIPLGGYVKLMGEDGDFSKLTPAEQARALPRQAAWKRFLIFFGGPFFNFVLSVIVFMAIQVIGEPQVSSVIGRVAQGSYAEKIGLRSGDRVLSIDGKPIAKFDELLNAVNDHPSQLMRLEIARPLSPGSTQTRTMALDITPQDESGLSVYGESVRVGDLDGIFASPRAGQVGISDPSSLAARAGLKTGDKITAFNGQPIDDWEVLEALYISLSPGAPAAFKAERADGKTLEWTWSKPKSARGLGPDFGLHSSEMFVEKTVAKSPAEKAGIRNGDHLIAVGGTMVRTFFELKDLVQASGKKDNRVIVQWMRGGKTFKADITPTATTSRDALLKKQTQFTVGVMPMLVWKEPVQFIERTLNPFTLLYKGTERMVIFCWRNFVSIKKMLTGDVSVSTLGGPILIGKLAGESISRGLIAFLTTMGILSIGLGVLNILPVPILDGGHMLLLVIEVVRGKPLTLRQMELVQQVGLSLILVLMAFVIRNDIMRLPFFD